MSSLSSTKNFKKLTIKIPSIPFIKYSHYVKEMNIEDVKNIYNKIDDIYSINYKYIGLLKSKENLYRHFIFVKSYKKDIQSTSSIEINQLFYQSTGTSREHTNLNFIWLPCKYYKTGNHIFKPESNNNLKNYKTNNINNNKFLNQIKYYKRFINKDIALVSKFIKQNYYFLIDNHNSNNNNTTLKIQNNSNKTIFNFTSSNLFSEYNIEHLKSLDNNTKNFKTYKNFKKYNFLKNASRKNTYKKKPQIDKSLFRLTHKLKRKTI